MKFMRQVVKALCLTVLPVVVFAHHSRAEFSAELLELKGEIVGLFWANPHPHVAINVVKADGTKKLWRVEMWTNLFGTERAGVTRELFNVGDLLTVAGQVSSRRDGYMLGNNLLFADGREAVLNIDSAARWNDRLLSAEASSVDDDALLAQAASENRGIFRVWTPTNFYEAWFQPRPFTEAALAARAEWDELENFLTRCEQPGMPLTMMSPQEYELIDDGNTVRIRAQFFDTTRIVHMQDIASPDDQPFDHLGYSVGRWEGSTLVVETTRSWDPHRRTLHAEYGPKPPELSDDDNRSGGVHRTYSLRSQLVGLG
jgi:hypothetical protein